MSAGTNFAVLHRYHLALHEVQEQLTRGPRQVKAREQLVVQADTELNTKKDQFKQLRVTSDRKSLDLKTNEAKIADLRGKLNACSSNREFDIIKGQIEAKAVRKLQHPVRSKQLKGFLERLTAGAGS